MQERERDSPHEHFERRVDVVLARHEELGDDSGAHVLADGPGQERPVVHGVRFQQRLVDLVTRMQARRVENVRLCECVCECS